MDTPEKPPVEPSPAEPSHAGPAQAAPPHAEPRGERLRRHARRTRLYAWAFALVALLIVVIALAVANTRQVRISWVVGTTTASLVWIVLAAAVLGWLLGIATSVVFRLRTRRHHRPEKVNSR